MKHSTPSRDLNRREELVYRLKKNFSIQQATIIALIVIPDAISIGLAAAIAYNLRFGSNASTFNAVKVLGSLDYKQIVTFLALGWIATLIATGSYKFEHSTLAIFNQRAILRRSINYFFAIGFLSFIIKASFSRSIFLMMLGSGLLLLFFVRLLIHTLIIKPLILSKTVTTKLLIIGRSKSELDEHSDWLISNRRLGYKIAARMICNDINFTWIEEFDRQMRYSHATEVLLLPGMETDKNFSKFIHYLEDLDIHVNWVPLDSGNLGYWQIPSPQEGIPFLTFERSEITWIQRTAKRIFDIFFSLVVIVLISPVLLMISTMIIATDGRPVFYTQKRIGKDGKPFKFIKFRSMIKNAEELVHTVENVHGNKHVLFKNQKDPRVTKIGRVLRKYSLDELPQFFNVLTNSMSVVGPRPALPREVNVYSSIYERRLIAKPGITGPWQVSGRSDLDLQTSVALDLNYLTNWSFSRDLWIILATVGAVVKGRGAY